MMKKNWFWSAFIVLTMISFTAAGPAAAAEWALSTDFGFNISTIAVSDSSNIWCTEGTNISINQGRIIHFDGNLWTTQTSTFTNQTGCFYGAFAYDNRHAWVVGYSEGTPDRGLIYSYDGNEWSLSTEINTGSYTQLHDVYSPDAENIWVSANVGEIYYSGDSGSSWQLDTDLSATTWNSIHGTDENHIWAAGGYVSTNRIIFYDGTDWEVQTEFNLGSNKHLRDIFAISDDDVWAIGDTGIILHYDGTTWQFSTDLGDTSGNASITALSSDRVWAGVNGTNEGIYFYNGSDWSLETDGITPDDLDCRNPGELWTAADDEVYRKGIISRIGIDYSTYLGGSDSSDYGYGIARDSDDTFYVTGVTYSDNFPTVNPYQAAFAAGSNRDCVLSKFSSSGSAMIYSTYLGGSGVDEAYGVDLDSLNRAYITGQTFSSDFPTQEYATNLIIQAGYGGSGDAFVTKFNSSGLLYYSTYLGGGDEDTGKAIALNSSLQAYIVGSTQSSNFPTQAPFQASSAGSRDIFVAKIRPNGSALEYSTYFGGTGNDWAEGIAVDTASSAYITGQTYSPDFPTTNPFQASRASGQLDGFVSKFSPTGNAIFFSTYLGGSGAEWLEGIALGPEDDPHVIGYTTSADFPTVNPYQASWAEETKYDICVSHLSSSGSALLYSSYLGGNGVDYGHAIATGSEGSSYLIGSTNSEDFPTLNPYQASRGGSNDIFIALFDQRDTLTYSTYLGGTGGNYGQGITSGEGGDFLITGYTSSTSFPVKNAYQSSKAGGSYDSIVARLTQDIIIGTPTPVPTPSSSPTPSITATPSATPTTTPSATPTPRHTTTPTPTPVPPTATPTPRYTTTPIPITTRTPSPTPTCGPTVRPPHFIVDSGDYNGDGTSDIAIFRSSSGLWAVRGVTRVYFGNGFDQPVSGDYDGDGGADIAIFRPPLGLWAIRGVSRIYYGTSGDRTAPADYDGDGITDVAIFRAGVGLWAIRGVTRAYYGTIGDSPIPGDYDGSGTSAIGIFRPRTGLWSLRDISRIYFGSALDWTLPADYDGDGLFEVAIFRPSAGLWAIRGLTRAYFGCCLDYPLRADFDGNGTADITIFRQGYGLWAVRGITRAYFGATNDTPVTR